MFEHLLKKNPNVKDALMRELREDDIIFIGALITFVKEYEAIEKV